MFMQLYDYMENILNQLLCGFCRIRWTQHPLCILSQKELDQSGFIDTILLDL